MSKNLAKVTSACDAKTTSEGQEFSTPWVIYNPESTNFKVLYSVHGVLSSSNEYYGDEFANCGSGSGSGSGSDSGTDSGTDSGIDSGTDSGTDSGSGSGNG